MRILDESKTKELTYSETDLSAGYMRKDKLLVAHHDAVAAKEGQGHYEVVREYPNGGKDVEYVTDVPAVAAQEAYDEYEDVLVYIPYTERELAKAEISSLKNKLAETDYRAIKFAEGEISETDYAPVRALRRGWRARINELQEKTGEE